MQITEVILVDEQDQPQGSMEKMEAHRKGLLHRAFSVFIFNAKGEMLLQQRATGKYHSGGLWTNACCGHPVPGEKTKDAARRRLNEELGFVTEVETSFEFVYKADLDNGLTEYEYDHVFTGEYNGAIDPNPEEVMDICYRSMEDIRSSLQLHPQKYTIWFHLAFPKIETWWINKFGKRVF